MAMVSTASSVESIDLQRSTRIDESPPSLASPEVAPDSSPDDSRSGGAPDRRDSATFSSYPNCGECVVQKVIPLNEVTCVKRAKTAGIFPNAIETFAGKKKLSNLFVMDCWNMIALSLGALLHACERKGRIARVECDWSFRRKEDDEQIQCCLGGNHQGATRQCFGDKSSREKRCRSGCGNRFDSLEYLNDQLDS